MRARLTAVLILFLAVAPIPAQSTPSDVGEWAPLQSLPYRPVHSILLPSGEIYFFFRGNTGNVNNFPRIWDPATGNLTTAPDLNFNAFCSGHVPTADGRIFIAGGTVTNNVGLADATIYEPSTNSYSPVPDMNAGRYYPTLVSLANGDVVALSGSINVGVKNLIPEVWEAASGAWRDLSSASMDLPLYPAAFLAPNGKVFLATNPSRYLDTGGSGQWTTIANRLASNRDNYGSACLFDDGKALYTGGGNPPLASNEVIDLNSATPSWSYIAPMPAPRRQHNTTLLPDGRVLVTGGSSATGFDIDDGPKPAIVWDPATNMWETWATEDQYRGYHSESVLLPDARVVSIGGDGHPTLQVFSPPYLFGDPRPVITATPASVTHGETFFVATPDGASMFDLSGEPDGQVNWLRPSSVTHTKNMNQRINRLAFTETAGGLEVTAPSNPDLSPVGDYMLFLVNSSGVPSVAAWVRLLLDSLVPGLVESWQFEVDGRSGTQTNDATLQNGASVVQDTERGQVLSCDGIDDRAEAFNSITPAFSWTAWIRTSVDNQNGGVFGYEGDALISSMVTGNGDDFALSILNNQLSFYTGNPEQTVVSSVLLNDDAWHHVAVTVDSTGVNLYVDGVLDGTGVGVTATLDENASVFFCGDPSEGGYFEGLLDAVEQYDRALNSNEVLQLATVGGGTAPLAVTNIVSPPIAIDTSTQFTATASGGANLMYEWDFGDGTVAGISDSRVVDKAYSAPGLYLVTLTVSSATGETAVENFFQAVHRPHKPSRPTSSMSIVYEERVGNDRVWNVNPDNDTVSVFNTVTHAKEAEILVGDSPRSLAQAPNGLIWVANKHSATISIIDPASLAVAQTVDLPNRSQPHGIVFDPAGTAAYVTLEALGQLLKLDPADASNVLGTANLGANVRQLAVTWDSADVLVSRFITPKLPGEETDAPTTTNAGGQNVGGEVLLVDAASMTLSKTIVLQHSEANDGAGHNHENGHASARGIPNYLGAPALSPDGESAWIPSKQDNIKRGMLRDGLELTHDTTYRAISSYIDLDPAVEAENYAARIDHDNGAVPSAAVHGYYGNYVFVALEGSRAIRVIDAYGNNEINGFTVGRAPQGLAMSPDGLTLYTHNFMDRSISVHDVSEIVLETGPSPDLVATYSTVATEVLSPTVVLGKRIFYDAEDPRISAESYISCAGCHNDGDQDGRIWDFTGFGEGLRNTIDLRGRANHGPMHWTGNFDEVQDFECQMRALGQGEGFLSSPSDCDQLSDSLGAPKAGQSTELDALAAYVNSLTVSPASPFRNGDDSLTPTAAAGKVVFETNGCANCHSGSRFTDSALDVLHDVGTITANSGQRLGQGLAGLDTPSLKGAWSSAPYLHDGSAPTLADAILAHSTTGTLQPSELSDLEAYLKQIDSTEDELTASDAFAQDNGVVSMEAEHFLTNVEAGGFAPWSIVDLPPDPPFVTSNDQAIKAAAGGGTTNPGSYTTYEVQLEAGAQHVWLRARSFGSSSNSVFVQLQSGTLFNQSINPADEQWHWQSVSSPISVATPGIYTLTVARREGLAEIDKLVLTTDAGFDPELINSGLGPDESPRAGISDSQAPDEPGNLSTTSVTSSSVALQWDVAADNGPAGLAGYRVYRDDVFIDQVATTSYFDDTVTPNTEYGYEVTAVDNSVPSNESTPASIIVTTLADTEAPDMPANLSASIVGSDSVTLDWDSVLDNGGSGLQGYRIYRNDVLIGFSAINSYRDDTATPVTSYTYEVSAIDNVTPPNESARAAVAVTTASDIDPPATPQNLAAFNVTASEVSLQWAPSEDVGGSQIAGYRVYRDAVFVQEVVDTSFVDQNLAASTSYSYTVTAVDDAPTSNESSPGTAAIAITLPPPDLVAPNVPMNLSFQSIDPRSLQILWDPATDIGGGLVAGYRVYRDGQLISALVGPVEFYDSGLTAEQVYQYTVSTVDLAGNESAQSAALAAQTVNQCTAGGDPGLFLPAQEIYGGNATTVQWGDIDQDGDLDMFVAEGGKHNGAVPVLSWFEAPHWGRHDVGVPLEPFTGSSVLADIDNDGDLDLVVPVDAHSGQNDQGFVYWYENDGQAFEYWDQHIVEAFVPEAFHIGEVIVGDVDADGLKDIVVRHLSTPRFVVYFQNPDASWTPLRLDTRLREGLQLGDLDLNGKLDIIGNGFVLFAPTDPRNAAWTEVTIDDAFYTAPNNSDNNTTRAAVTDFNGDGRPDVVMTAAEGAAEVYMAWYEGPLEPFTDPWIMHQIDSPLTKNHQLELADIDLDGDVDIFGGFSFGLNGVVWWEDTAGDSLSFVKNTIDATGGCYSCITTDFDADGDWDFAGPRGYTGSVYLYENLAANPFEACTTAVTAPVNLAANASESQVDLSWDEPTDVGEGIDYYEVFRDGSLLASAVGSRAYVDLSVLPETQYSYQVRAIDIGGEASALSDVLVVMANAVPVANAGDDQTVDVTVTVNLDGSASSDADAGDTLTYLWSFSAKPSGSVAALSDATAVTPTFDADVVGEYIVQLVVNDGTVDSAPDSVTITAAPNAVPAADAGADQAVKVDDVVGLDGSASSDADAGDTLTYLWSFSAKPSGSVAALSDATVSNPTFVADVEGEYIVQLVVNDGTVDSAPDSVTITAAPNAVPVADAGADQAVKIDGIVGLDGGASSDADAGDTLTYLWSFSAKPSGSVAALSDATVSNPTFVADVEGEYIVQLVVNDGTDDSAPDSVTITATPNAVPAADAGADQAVKVDDIVGLDGSASSDADAGDTLTYLWSFSAKPSGSVAALSDATVSNPTFVADVEGEYIVQLVVNDGTDDSAPDSVTITATPNAVPVASAGDDQTVDVTVMVNLDGSASSDADAGDTLTYLWSFSAKPSGSVAALSDATAVTPTFDADMVGEYIVQLVVNDGTVDSAPDSVTITVIPNEAPVANAGADQAVKVDDVVGLDGSASSDADAGDTLTYLWSFSAKPSGSVPALSDATVSNPTFVADVEGEYIVQLVVNDGTVDSAPDSVTITAAPNAVPAADAGADQAVKVDDIVGLDGSASSDADAGDTLTYLWSFSAKPSGSVAALSDATAVTPTFDADVVGEYIVQLVVNDGTVDSAPDSVTITATPNAVPAADAGADQAVKVDDIVGLDGSASSDADAGDTLTYLWSFSAKPSGSVAALSDATVSNPTFVADVEGEYIVQLVVNDGTDDSAPDSVTITATPNAVPVANAGDDQTVDVTVMVNLDGSASSDADAGDTLTYLWSFSAKPSGSVAALSDATAVTPTFDADVVGEYIVQLVVNDGTVDSAPDSVTITVIPNEAPVADAGADQTVDVTVTVSLDGSASGDADAGDTLTYLWSFSAKPSGSVAALSDATAVTPTFDADMVGEYIVQLVVNDGTVDSAPDSVTITVIPNEAPVANAGADQAVKVDDVVGLDGSASSDADAGDTLTYLWSFSAKPSGSVAALSDATAVTPTFDADMVGEYIVQLVVNDGTVDSAPDSVTITAAPNAVPVANAGDDQTVDVTVTVNLDGSASSDADAGDTLAYLWSLTSVPSGSVAALSDAAASNPTFDADVVGDYIVQLVVNDGTVDSAPDSVTITAQTPNAIPVANPDSATATAGGASIDISVLENDFDADGNETLNAASVTVTSTNDPSTGTLSGPVGGVFTYTPLAEGTDSFSYTVADNQGAVSNAAAVTITIEPDSDGDGVPDSGDNCPNVANPGQANTDGDAAGDACDPDDDNDGIADAMDSYPTIPSNNCTQNDPANAAMTELVQTELTCAANQSISVESPTATQGGHLELIAPVVIFYNGVSAGALTVIAADPCSMCGP